LEAGINGYRVFLPFIFVWMFMAEFKSDFVKFWYEVLFTNELTHISWEILNRNHIAFKLSLHAVLGRTTVQLSVLFQGAITNIPRESDHIIEIPDFLTLREIRSHYPKKHQAIQFGEFVLNGPQAPAFDAFGLVKTRDGDPILICMQMKFAYHTDGQKISNDLINLEYSKVNGSIFKYLPGTDFVLLMPCRCLGSISSIDLPSKSAIILEGQLKGYYGKALYQRIKFDE
jgi:hypothetical protein